MKNNIILSSLLFTMVVCLAYQRAPLPHDKHADIERSTLVISAKRVGSKIAVAFVNVGSEAIAIIPGENRMIFIYTITEEPNYIDSESIVGDDFGNATTARHVLVSSDDPSLNDGGYTVVFDAQNNLNINEESVFKYTLIFSIVDKELGRKQIFAEGVGEEPVLVNINNE